MNSIVYLSKLLSDFVYLQYKFHTLHTDMAKSPIFMEIHLLVNDIYQFFGDDNIDWIKERCRVLWWFTPTSIFELSKLTWVKELAWLVPAMPEILKIIANDLRLIENTLATWMSETGKMNDLVTQNKLIDFATDIWVFRWKIEASIPSEVLPTIPKK